MPHRDDIENKILMRGRALWGRMQGESPGLFDRNFWMGRVLDWVMKDSGFKTDLLHFVDVLPALKTPDQIAAHVREYLLKPGREWPLFLKSALHLASGSWSAPLLAGIVREQVAQMASQFIAGNSPEEAVPRLRQLHEEGVAFTADLLGEATLSEREADAEARRYENLIGVLSAHTGSWRENPLLDQNHAGPIPRANVSVKISALEPHLDVLDIRGSVARLKKRIWPLCVKAKENKVFFHLDLEQWAYHEITFALFEELMTEPELCHYPHVGIVVQAYLKSAEQDIQRLLALVRKRGTPLTVRLVKGAYWDYEVLQSRQCGTPCPVWTDKAETDAQYEHLSSLLLTHFNLLWPAFGSHNLRSLLHVLLRAEEMNVPKNAFEIQMLFGMAEPERNALKKEGYRLRLYSPIGDWLPGMSYLVRRLLENTSNSGFLRQRYHEGKSVDLLLEKPRGPDSGLLRNDRKNNISETSLTSPFDNTPLTDFTQAVSRKAFQEGLARAKALLPLEVPVVIGGVPRKVSVRKRFKHFCPSENNTQVASVHCATPDEVREAGTLAEGSSATWRLRPLIERAELLEKLGSVLERDRLFLAAMEVLEVGKSWREADADLAEAIDFCHFYAGQALIELSPKKLPSLPGERNLLFFEGRGPTAVIAPWNFPLAILCGMAGAALVSGNPVLLKPAEQSSGVAHLLFEKMLEVGFPADVVHFLPGLGEETGAALVQNPQVAQVLFTGGKKAGQHILGEAARFSEGQRRIKKVVCEMGGKNALIVDSDADWDEAIRGIVSGAFGFAGQKCSACSRVLFVGGKPEFDLFCERLSEVCRTLDCGKPEDPGCRLGPVIDGDAVARLLKIRDNPGPGCTLLFSGKWKEGGCFVPPALFVTDRLDSILMQEELFGPFLALYRCETFDGALSAANDTGYALTGAVFSRLPSHLLEAQKRFRVGNLYFNRSQTGASVGRQPFGGFALSGTGPKAGGPGYLSQLVEARCVTENTLRHGFVPEEE